MAYQLFTNVKKAAPWWYPGKIRRAVILFFGISLLASPILYFVGRGMVSLWYNSSWNEYKYENQDILNEDVNQLKDIQVSRTEVLELVDETKDLYVVVNNKVNQNKGYDPFTYELTTLDNSGTVLDREIRQTFLKPGEVFFVIKNTDNLLANFLEVKVLPEESKVYYQTKNNPTSKKDPDLRITNNDIFYSQEEGLSLSMSIYNPEDYDIKDLDLTYILRNNEQDALGIGHYTLSNVPARDVVDVELDYPLNKNQEIPIFLDVRWRYKE